MSAAQARACELLIEKRADITVRDTRGQLAAYTAALEAGNAQTALMLRDEAQKVQERAQLELLGDASGALGIAPGKAGGSGSTTGKAKRRSKGKSVTPNKSPGTDRTIDTLVGGL